MFEKPAHSLSVVVLLAMATAIGGSAQVRRGNEPPGRAPAMRR